MSDTYWGNKGKYQALADRLHTLIPSCGSVDSIAQNQALETFRIASNCYYDLFNNGLCNRVKEFRDVFGFPGVWIAKQGFPYHQPLETRMDEIIANAAIEQGICVVKGGK